MPTAATTKQGTVAEIEPRVATSLAEVRPQPAIVAFLARHTTGLSVRLARLKRYLTANVALRVRHAETKYPEPRPAAVDYLHAWIHVEPATFARRFAQSPSAIDRMLESWNDLRHEFTGREFTGWDCHHAMLASSLTGHVLFAKGS